MADPKITFEDIDSPTLRQEMKSLIDELAQICPSDAAFKATFRFFQNRFLADIKIFSHSAVMHVGEQAAALGELYEQVKAKLLPQVLSWRNQRFAS